MFKRLEPLIPALNAIVLPLNYMPIKMCTKRIL